MRTLVAMSVALAMLAVGCGGKKGRGGLEPAAGSVAAQATQGVFQPTANPSLVAVQVAVSGPASPAVGDTIEVAVLSGPLADLYGVAFDLNYNPAVLDLVGADARRGMLAAGEFVTADRNGKAGRRVVGLTLAGLTPPVAGAGEVVRFQFRAKAAGSSAFTLTEGAFFDSNGDPIALTLGTAPTVVVR